MFVTMICITEHVRIQRGGGPVVRTHPSSDLSRDEVLGSQPPPSLSLCDKSGGGGLSGFDMRFVPYDYVLYYISISIYSYLFQEK